MSTISTHMQQLDLVRSLLAGGVNLENRQLSIRALARCDIAVAIGMESRPLMFASMVTSMVTNDSVLDNNIYRISVSSKKVDVICFGLSRIDSPLEGYYDTVDDLPQWVKERLAVLMITDSTPPTQEVAGIGRRISRTVYWVYAPETTS